MPPWAGRSSGNHGLVDRLRVARQRRSRLPIDAGHQPGMLLEIESGLHLREPCRLPPRPGRVPRYCGRSTAVIGLGDREPEPDGRPPAAGPGCGLPAIQRYGHVWTNCSTINGPCNWVPNTPSRIAYVCGWDTPGTKTPCVIRLAIALVGCPRWPLRFSTSKPCSPPFRKIVSRAA